MSVIEVKSKRLARKFRVNFHFAHLQSSASKDPNPQRRVLNHIERQDPVAGSSPSSDQPTLSCVAIIRVAFEEGVGVGRHGGRQIQGNHTPQPICLLKYMLQVYISLSKKMLIFVCLEPIRAPR